MKLKILIQLLKYYADILKFVTLKYWDKKNNKNIKLFKKLKYSVNWPFKLVGFIFPFQATWRSEGKLPFAFSLVMNAYARRHLQEKVLWGNVTGSALEKQNMQAKKVYSKALRCELLEFKHD